MTDWMSYIGIPFERGKRSQKGADCYGLAALIYEKELGVKLPNYDYDKGEEEDQIDLVREFWREVPIGERMPYDLLLIRVMGVLAHIGIVMDEKRMLHTQNGSNSGVQRYDKRWSHRIEGVFRYEE